MKIQIRKIINEETKEFDEHTNRYYKIHNSYENGYVEEIEINDPAKEISAFSFDKSLRLIGIGKNLYSMTLKSWKETKKELSKLSILQKFDLSKQN